MSQVESAGFESSYSDAMGALTGGAGNADLDKEAFLTLLITQFQYQDPLNPMDDKEFIAQLAQFSALEQSMELNAKMEQVVVSNDQQTTISITNYIGKEVSGRGLGLSKQDGNISVVQYAAGEEMADCYVNILDANNSVVATVQLGSKAAGIHDFTWDGKSSNGIDLPDGVYQVAFSGKNKAGDNVMIDTSVSGKVVGTAFYEGAYYLRLSDGRSIALTNVREVVEPGTYDTGAAKPGTTYQGTNKDDYMEGKEGYADTILAGDGDDMIVYDADDELIDGGDGFDVLIASGDVGDNANNYEAILRGPNASDIKSVDDLKDLGLKINGDGYADVNDKDWQANWTHVKDNQWTYSGEDAEDKVITLELLKSTELEETTGDAESTPETATQNLQDASQAVQTMSNTAEQFTSASSPDFNAALARGTAQANQVANGISSMSADPQGAINRLMQSMTN